MKNSAQFCLVVGLTFATSMDSVAVTVQPVVPRAAFVESMELVEPITMLQGAAAVVSIAGTLFNGKDMKEVKQRLAEISGKLDIVIQRQDTILAEIVALKVYFNEALRASFEKEARIDFVALKDRFDVSIAANTQRAQIAALKTLHADAERVAFRMKEYGPASYQTAFAAASVLAVINYRTNVPRTQRSQAMRQISTKFAEWLQPTGAESVPLVLDETIAQRSKLETQIATFPRTHKWTVKTDSRWTGTARCNIHIIREVVIAGDIATEFTATESQYEEVGSCERPECRLCLTLRDVEVASAPYIAARQRMGSSLSAARLSNIPQLGAIRSIHDEWKAQGEAVARLEAMIVNIGTAKQAIDEWGEM